MIEKTSYNYRGTELNDVSVLWSESNDREVLLNSGGGYPLCVSVLWSESNDREEKRPTSHYWL